MKDAINTFTCMYADVCNVCMYSAITNNGKCINSQYNKCDSCILMQCNALECLSIKTEDF